MLLNEKGQIYHERIRATREEPALFLFAICCLLIPCCICGVLFMEQNEMPYREVVSLVGGLCIAECIFIVAFICGYDMNYAKFEIHADGIWTKFPYQSKRFIPWNGFKEVCICYTDYHRYNGVLHAYIVICFVKNEATKDVKGRWNPNSILNYRNIIAMDYTYDLYEEVKEKWPLGVIDLRDTPEYAIK